jgi:hypothetical protein
MRSSIVKSFALGIVTGGFLTAGIVAAVPAKADPSGASVAYAAVYGQAVCSTLDDYPNYSGIVGIAQAIVDDGLSYRQAGEVIAVSVIELCPRHLGLIKSFAADTQRQTA